MTRFDAANSDCRIFTRRAGVLGAVGHDLELRVADYRIDLEEGPLRVDAQFSAASLRMVGVVEHGRTLTGRLSTHDTEQIQRQIAEEVLQSAVHALIEFHSTRVERRAQEYRIEGLLELHGVERELHLIARPDGAARLLVSEAVLHQPDFGIKPFRAFGGALRVRPEVTVRVSVPLAALAAFATPSE